MLAAGEWDLLPLAGLSPVTPEAPWLRGLSKGEAPGKRAQANGIKFGRKPKLSDFQRK